MPSPDQFKKALELISKRSANYNYFFAELDSSDWLEPLESAGFFSSPPAALREGDAVRFPFWPESHFLSRIADEAPAEVARIISRVPETDNVRVYEDFADAALRMDGSNAAVVAERIRSWLARQDFLYSLLPEKVGALALYLAESGNHKSSLELLRSLLRTSRSGTRIGEARAMFNAWEYAEILRERFPGVLSAVGLPALELIYDVLADTLDATDDGDEFSRIWRPAIEADAQNMDGDDVLNALVDTARDAASTLSHASRESLEDVLAATGRRTTPLFARLLLHLANENRSIIPDRALRAALFRENFEDRHLHHEYSLLLRNVFPQLSREQQDVVMMWIESGPPGVRKEDSESFRSQLGYWKARWLATLGDGLPARWRKRYEELTERVGEPEHPHFLSYSTSWTGPTSPKTRKELSEMSPREIAEFLHVWTPDEGSRVSQPEGLGRILQSVVANESPAFVEHLPLFKGTDPTYARSIVQGLSDAVKQEQGLDWERIVDYLDWIVRQPRSIEGRREGESDQDPHCGWARKASARLLSLGFEKNLLSWSLRRSAWEILSPLTDDPDPTPDDDARSSLDPATHAINSTRGEAMHAVIHYALWCRRRLEEANVDGELQPSSEAMPEVYEVLNERLEADPSPAIRAVYGEWFPWLVMLDRDWSIDRCAEVFSRGPQNARLRAAAWDSYVVSCGVYNEVFEILRPEYIYSIEEREDQELEPRRSVYRMGEHVMALVGRGLVAFGDDDALLTRYFERTPDEVAARAIAFVGGRLKREGEAIENAILQRYKDFWERLKDSLLARESPPVRTLQAFGWWFASGKFDLVWSFDNLLEVIRLTKGAEPDHLVMERLAVVVSQEPCRSIEVVRALVSEAQAGRVFAAREHLRAILTTALADVDASTEARALIHELGARGHSGFRDLL